MTVAAVVTNEKQLDELLSWGTLISGIHDADLLLLIAVKSKSQKTWIDLLDECDESDSSFIRNARVKLSELKENWENDSDHDRVLNAKVFSDPQPGWALVEEVQGLKVSFLILPFLDGQTNSDENAWCLSIYQRAPCEVLQISCKELTAKDELGVLITVSGKPNDAVALRRGVEIAESTNGVATALFVEPNIDFVSYQVGQKSLEKFVKSALGSKSNVKQRVVLANNLIQGIKQLDLTEFDVVISGTRSQREITQLMIQPTSSGKDQPVGFAAIRRSIPYTNKFVSQIQSFFERCIPQLSREQRIDLVQRIQPSSQWDFDFIALICLSTFIAGLGLIGNSAAVVIGAMLVAPLMTPLAGAGLALAQGNFYLLKMSLATVVKGFLTAFMIGVIVGLVGCREMSAEMMARTAPGFNDLLIALASGVAAAYAMGRPNLVSALPGVAIAAALVPPLATAGIMFSALELHLSLGAWTLFFTNIVAIVLGTTVTFWAVGIRGEKKSSDQLYPVWPRWLLLVLVVLTLVLTWFMRII